MKKAAMHVHAKWISRAPYNIIRLRLFADVGHELLTKQETPQTQHLLVCTCPLQWDGVVQSLGQLWRGQCCRMSALPMSGARRPSDALFVCLDSGHLIADSSHSQRAGYIFCNLRPAVLLTTLADESMQLCAHIRE